MEQPVSRNPVIISSGGEDNGTGIVLYQSLEEYKLDLRTEYGLWELNFAHLNPYWSHLLITWNELNELALYYDGKLTGKTSTFKYLSTECSDNIRHGCSKKTGNSLIFGRPSRNMSSYVITCTQVAEIILAEHQLHEATNKIINWEGKEVHTLCIICNVCLIYQTYHCLEILIVDS